MGKSYLEQLKDLKESEEFKKADQIKKSEFLIALHLKNAFCEDSISEQIAIKK